MDPIARFVEYATAFEEVVKDDDFSVLEPFFTEDAVYEILGGPRSVQGRFEGREAVFTLLKRSLDEYDRRFETREVEVLEGPTLRQGAVWMRWRASYRSPGVPELVLEGEETVDFEGDRIARLEDRYGREAENLVDQWLEQYASRLPAPPS